MELSIKNMALISLTNVWVVQLQYAEIKHYGLNFTRHVMSFGYEIVPVFYTHKLILLWLYLTNYKGSFT